jgi:hypothetical protein
MSIQWWQIIGILALAGCGSQNSGNSDVERVPDSSDRNSAQQPNMAEANQGNELSNTTAEKPNIDLEVVSIDLPGTIKREADFPITVTVRNNSDTELSFAVLDVRAVVKSPFEAMDLALGSGTARNFGPHDSKTVTFTVRAPDVVAAPTVIWVEAKPGLATDPNPANNLQRKETFVVN